MLNPFYNAIAWLIVHIHSGMAPIFGSGSGAAWALSIVLLTMAMRLLLFPLFVKQIKSQRAMSALQPQMKELQAKYKGDQQTLREEMMKLYQTEKVNPLMGCLPLLLQIPVFFGLFHVLRGLNPANPATRELYGWTGAQWDSAIVARLFTAPLPAHFSMTAAELAHLDASGVAVKIVAGILVLIMMVTTFMTSRQMILKTGWSQDPQQRMIQKLMLYGITFSLLLSGWYFPIGVIIYWVTQNLFSFGQQYWVLHKYPPPAVAGAMPVKGAGKAVPGKTAPGKVAPKPAPGAKPAIAAKGPSAKPVPGGKPTVGTKPAIGTRPGASDKTPPKAGSSTGQPAATPEPPADGSKNGSAPPAKSTPARTTPARTTPASPPASPPARGSSASKSARTPAKAPAPSSNGDGASPPSADQDGSGALPRAREGDPTPATPTDGQPPPPRVGAKPPNRARKRTTAGKSNRKGGSKR